MTQTSHLNMNIPSMSDAPDAQIIFDNFVELDGFAGNIERRVYENQNTAGVATDKAEEAISKASNAYTNAELASEIATNALVKAEENATEIFNIGESISTIESDILVVRETANNADRVANVTANSLRDLEQNIGDIDSALDAIIEIQNSLIGGVDV